MLSRSFNQDDAAAVKEFKWSAEEEAEWKKNTQCCERVLGPMNRDKKLIKKLFDVTPEAAYAMPDDFTVKECPKKCTNFKKFRLDIASEFYGLVLYQLAGECPSLEDKYRDEDKWKMTLSEGWSVTTFLMLGIDKNCYNCHYLFRFIHKLCFKWKTIVMKSTPTDMLPSRELLVTVSKK